MTTSLRKLTGDHVTWVRRLVEAVDVMGEGGVSPNMVSGVEMAKPWGFDDVKEAVASAREGFEYLMSRGVVPHLDTGCVEPGTTLAGHPPIPLDFLIQADLAWYETWRKYKLPPFAGYGRSAAGPVPPCTATPGPRTWAADPDAVADPGLSDTPFEGAGHA